MLAIALSVLVLAAPDKELQAKLDAIAKQLQSGKAEDIQAGLAEVGKLGLAARPLLKPLCDLMAVDDLKQVGEVAVALQSVDKNLAALALKIRTSDESRDVALLQIRNTKNPDDAKAVAGLVAWTVIKTNDQHWSKSNQGTFISNGLNLLRVAGDTSDGHFEAARVTVLGFHPASAFDSIRFLASRRKNLKDPCARALVATLEKIESTARAEAAKALGDINANKEIALEPLKKVLGDPKVNREALAAIQKIQAAKE